MKIAALLGLCIVAYVQPAMAENAANAHLLSLAPEVRATILGETVGEGCVGKTAFYMGMAESGFAKDKGFWSIRCQDNRAFVVEVNPDGTSSILECAVLMRVGGGECFKRLAD
jgi:hypothetical protein